jgi:hypothetical protein
MESHYARKSSKKQFVAHDLSIKRKWQLYKDWCSSKGYVLVKESKNKQIFCENFFARKTLFPKSSTHILLAYQQTKATKTSFLKIQSMKMKNIKIGEQFTITANIVLDELKSMCFIHV